MLTRKFSLVTNKEADSLVTLVVIDKASLCAEPLSVIRNLHHQIKQTKNCCERAASVAFGRKKVDRGVITNVDRCILVFTRRELDNHFRSTKSICNLVGRCPNLVCLSYNCDDLRMTCLNCPFEAGMRKNFGGIKHDLWPFPNNTKTWPGISANDLRVFQKMCS